MIKKFLIDFKKKKLNSINNHNNKDNLYITLVSFYFPTVKRTFHHRDVYVVGMKM